MKKMEKDSSSEYVLYYEDLDVLIPRLVSEAVLYPAELASPAEYEDIEAVVDYEYELPEDLLYEYFYENSELYSELKDLSDKECLEYISANAEALFDKYYDDLLRYFKKYARKDAERNI